MGSGPMMCITTTIRTNPNVTPKRFPVILSSTTSGKLGLPAIDLQKLRRFVIPFFRTIRGRSVYTSKLRLSFLNFGPVWQTRMLPNTGICRIIHFPKSNHLQIHLFSTVRRTLDNYKRVEKPSLLWVDKFAHNCSKCFLYKSLHCVCRIAKVNQEII